MTKGTLFRIAVALQVALLGWMVAASERTLAGGARVVLKVRPVDPIDFMTGRFVNAHPEIGRIDLVGVPLVGAPADGPATTTRPAAPDRAALQNRRVSVELQPSGSVWVAQRVVCDGGGISPRAPFLRGRIASVQGDSIDVDYGIERFDIPFDAEDPTPLTRSAGHVVTLVVKVASDGRCVTEDLQIDGQPFAAWNAAEKAKK